MMNKKAGSIQTYKDRVKLCNIYFLNLMNEILFRLKLLFLAFLNLKIINLFYII